MRQLKSIGSLLRSKSNSLVWLLCALSLWSSVESCRAADVNILVVIADDMGAEVAPLYPVGTNKPPMPVLQGLQTNGVTFLNAYANPLCSPTRATLLTGRYGFRTGVEFVATTGSSIGVVVTEPSIPRALRNQLNITSAAFGKWHIGRQNATAPQTPQDHPILMGFSRYVGSPRADLAGFTSWDRYVNNLTLNERLTTSTTYATTDVVNESVSWINRNGNSNWMCWVAFNAPHDPFHKPPNALHSYDALADIGAPNRSYYEASCEAMDTELGRLLSSIPTAVRNKTMVVFIGDNGTPNAVKRGGYRGSKATVYEGGSRVPFVVSGALVANPNRTSNVLVNTTDLFATVMDVHGINLSAVNEGLPQDTVSILPYVQNLSHPTPRTTAYVSHKSNATATADYNRSVRNDRYKLLRFTLGATGVTSEEFYDLQLDELETTNILLRTLTTTEQTNLNNLRTRLAELSN